MSLGTIVGMGLASGALGQDRNFDGRPPVAAFAPPSLPPAVESFVDGGGLVSFDFTGVTRSLTHPTRPLTGPASGAAEGIARAWVQANADLLGLTPGDLREFRTEVVPSISGTTHIYLTQEHLGIQVYNGRIHVGVNPVGQITGVWNTFAPLANSVGSAVPEISAAEALAAAAQHLGIASRTSPQLVAELGGVREEQRFVWEELSASPITATLQWLPISALRTDLVWNFQLELPSGEHWYDFTVGASGDDVGRVWTRFDWVSSGQYRVYEQPTESPIHTSPSPPSDARTLVVNPEDSTASPSGWFHAGTTNLDGNNVHACPDRNGNNACDSQVSCTGSLVCDFSLNLSSDPSNSIPAATTNLFYWNNVIHDIQHQYGFDEPGGNFQEDNFGRGGAGSDSVNADAQDGANGASNCNANFGTPPDGGNPRMQMFTCDNAFPERDGSLDNGVIVHEYGHGISIRQVGGPSTSSCLGNAQQAGEGWSDFFALVYTAEAGDQGTDPRGVGSYLFGLAPDGTIRPQRYSTSSAINNYTYESIDGLAIPHGVGSVWAQAAWEAYWALVDVHGFEGDLLDFDLNDPNEAGNKRALFYINEGLKNTACSPTFVDNRNGIIEAATNSFGGEDVCILWEAFANFGLGTNAISGGSNSTNPTNGFDLPQECTEPPPPPPPAGSCLFTENFSTGAGSFVFVDDPQDPAYTSGAASGGNVSVAVGGVDDADISNMLGSWDVSCDLDSSTEVSITLAASLTQAANYESNETSELRLTVNGSTDVLASFTGDGNGGAAQTTGLQTFEVSTTLPAGTSTLSLGCFNNLKTLADEQTDCVFDSVSVEEDGEPPPPPPPGCLHEATFESGADGWTNGADTCTTGSFVVGSPDPVSNGGVVTQVSGGAGGSVNAFFTQPNTGGAGTDDVDGGTCEALSPIIDASAESAVEVTLSYFHGQRDAGGDPTDGFLLDVLNNGVVVDTLVSIGDVTSNAAWSQVSTTINNPGNIQLRARATDGPATGDLVEAGIDNVQICSAAPPSCTVDDDFEDGAAGWSNDSASTCTTGAYVLGTPTLQSNGGVVTQVGGANSGANAIFTATNSSAGVDDVDGGNCILGSPTFNVSEASTLSVAYFHGQRDAGDDPGGDFFQLEVSTNGGASFTTIASNGDATQNAAWTTANTSIPAGSDVVVRVQCSDGAGPGDLVECGIDDLSICSN